MSGSFVATQVPSVPTPTSTERVFDPREVESVDDAADVILDTLYGLWQGLLAALPLIVIGLLIFVGGLFVAGLAGRYTERGLHRTSADRVAVSLTRRLVTFLVAVVFALIALAVAGVKVGAALATLGIAGVALAFAMQNILENFVAGIILMIRKPFRAGDQIRTSDFEGTVEEIDLRVTTITTYDGEVVLIPNSDVFRTPLHNRTRRGRRRSTHTIAVDYRDDHVAAHGVILGAIRGIEGVLREPEPEVLLMELGDSGIIFEMRYWTLPDNRTVRRVQDRVLASAKSAIEEAGMTIPWPMRTLYFDTPLRLSDREPSPDQ